MAGIAIRIKFIWVYNSWGCGLVASRAQWRFGIFSRASDDNQVNSTNGLCGVHDNNTVLWSGLAQYQ